MLTAASVASAAAERVDELTSMRSSSTPTRDAVRYAL